MAEGRVSAARLMFQRAAEACDVGAAFALGASYDPIMLQKLGVALLDPNVPAARSWYERAKELGSPEASQELEVLSNWHP
jgi:TPR repeat protein